MPELQVVDLVQGSGFFPFPFSRFVAARVADGVSIGLPSLPGFLQMTPFSPPKRSVKAGLLVSCVMAFFLSFWLTMYRVLAAVGVSSARGLGAARSEASTRPLEDRKLDRGSVSCQSSKGERTLL